MSVFRSIFETLREYYESRPPMPWWPDDPMEVIVGAVLVQGAPWTTVDRVLQAMRQQDLLDFKKIADMDAERLAETIRPVGFHTKKTQRLKSIAEMFLLRGDGELERFFVRDIDSVRKDLTGISGIGPGTADNIMLYAGKIPIYMVDPFTVRILIRHGIIDSRTKESEIQRLIHAELTPDEEPYGADLFCEFQRHVVHVGRDFCDKSKPDCGNCPLNAFLPENGPLGLSEQIRMTPTPRRPAVSAPKTEPKPEQELKPVEELELNDQERKIVGRLDGEPVSIDVLVQESGLPVHIVRATIAILEMRKIVRQVEGNRVKRV